MDVANIPIVAMVAVLFVIVALFILLRSFALPQGYFKNRKKRSEIRMRLLEKKYEEKQEKSDAAEVKESNR